MHCRTAADLPDSDEGRRVQLRAGERADAAAHVLWHGCAHFICSCSYSMRPRVSGRERGCIVLVCNVFHATTSIMPQTHICSQSAFTLMWRLY